MLCFVCKKEKPIQNYTKKYNDGTILTYNKCVECRKAYVEKAKKEGRKKGIVNSLFTRKLKAIERKKKEILTLEKSVKKIKS